VEVTQQPAVPGEVTQPPTEQPGALAGTAAGSANMTRQLTAQVCHELLPCCAVDTHDIMPLSICCSAVVRMPSGLRDACLAGHML
jgi:hypothetical protein